MVPVDMVVNSMLVTPISVAKKNEYRIFHMGSSHRNPVQWKGLSTIIPHYIQGHIPVKAVEVPDCHLVKFTPYYWFKYYTELKIPAKLFWWYSKHFGSESQKKDASKLIRIERNMSKLTSAFHYFVDNEWMFDGTNLEEVREQLSPEDNHDFNFDTARIHWEMYIKFWMWGLTRYVLHDDFDPPDNDRKVKLFMGTRKMFTDIWFAWHSSRGPNLQTKKSNTKVYHSYFYILVAG